MTEGDARSPPWQVYVYFKVSPESRKSVIEQSVDLGQRLNAQGIEQTLMERADETASLTQPTSHTLMEVYTPKYCNKTNMNDFIQVLHEESRNWCVAMHEVPARVTEVFIKTEGL